MRLRLLACCSFMVFVAASVSTGHASAMTGDETSVAKALLGRINTARRDLELGSLKSWSVPVAEAAKHSSYQASRSRISHDGFGGRWERVAGSGSGISSMCENVGMAKGYESTSEASAILFDAWRRSRGHADCMFDRGGRSTWAGVGIKKVGTSTWYATFLAVGDSSRSAP